MWDVGLRTLTVSVAAVGGSGGCLFFQHPDVSKRGQKAFGRSGFKERAGMRGMKEKWGDMSHAFSFSVPLLFVQPLSRSSHLAACQQ